MRLLRRAAWGSACGILLLMLLFAGIATWEWNRTPSPGALMQWVRQQDAAHGSAYTPLTAISPRAGQALVAIEDERFYQHHGIDTIGLLRATWDDLRAGRVVEGGSTLTAQLAKNAYLHGYDHTISLKLQDLTLAFKIERHYSKQQILAMYLNSVYFGEGAYGIGAAAQRYFGEAPAQLDIAQAALLAGLVQAPSAYDPVCHPGLARQRQGAVLDRMLADGYITSAEARAARAEVLPFWRPNRSPVQSSYCTA